MPRGVYKRREGGLGPSENTQRLLESMRELEQRLAVERAKDRARALLVAFAQKHGLSALDLRNAAKLLADRKVGDAPVVSLMRTPSGPRTDKSKPAKGKVGKAIRAARLKLGLTDRALAGRLGTHKTRVNVWQAKGAPVPEQFHAPLIELLKLPKATFPKAAALSNGHAEASP